ncbi:hypothetical protein NPX13_g10824 [Xylaria arbuscula]|uniref:Uncharacterized protein n=1 Tax=Xylaria arbuscula TaxID=114810 RepID=A0A9W8N416_9PEZI|nr:hypothetical protein NPX13_g10824 [Xylaria arbuscula]
MAILKTPQEWQGALHSGGAIFLRSCCLCRPTTTYGLTPNSGGGNACPGAVVGSPRISADRLTGPKIPLRYASYLVSWDNSLTDNVTIRISGARRDNDLRDEKEIQERSHPAFPASHSPFSSYSGLLFTCYLEPEHTLATKDYTMSSLNTDLVLLPSIRGKLSELFSDDGIKDVQRLKVTQQLGELFGYVLVYHNKDVPKTMLHASMEELSKWKKEARKQGSTAFEEYPDTVQNYAKWPTERLKRNITAQGDQG